MVSDGELITIISQISSVLRSSKMSYHLPVQRRGGMEYKSIQRFIFKDRGEVFLVKYTVNSA
jgi:hypothetical protein